MIEHMAGIQRMRFAEASTFTWSRCRGVETSNLIAIPDDDCSKRFCDGCFDFLVLQHQGAQPPVAIPPNTPAGAHKAEERWHNQKSLYQERQDLKAAALAREAAAKEALKAAAKAAGKAAAEKEAPQAAAEQREHEAWRRMQQAAPVINSSETASKPRKAILAGQKKRRVAREASRNGDAR